MKSPVEALTGLPAGGLAVPACFMLGLALMMELF